MAHREPPLYMRVAEQLRERIRKGELSPGDPVPTERDLAKAHKISRGTAVKALDVLVSEGLVTAGTTRAGRRVQDRQVLAIHASRSEQMDHRKTAGVDAWVSDIQAYGHTPGQTIEVSVVPATAEIAEYLRVGEGERVVVRRRLRTVNGRPFNRSDSYYSMSLTGQVPEILDPADVTQGVIALMAERGIEQTHYEDRLRWRPPTPEEAQTLRLGPGVSVLIQARIGFAGDEVVRITRQVWPGDTIEIIYELPA